MAISLASLASPKSQLWLTKGEVQTKWTSLEKRIKDHPFNYAVELFIPHQSSLPSSISSLPVPLYYHTESLPLSHFFLPSLLCRYFTSTSESLVALSPERRVDVHNVFAVLPSGKLVMSIDKDTFEELGLQGKCSRYQKHRYVVEVDLKAEYFKPGKPCYERTNTCVTNQQELQAHFIFSLDCCDESVQTQFMADFKATKQECHFEQEVLTDFALPVINGEHPRGHHDDTGVEVYSGAQDFHTWLGGVACGLDVYEGGAPGDYVTTFSPPECSEECEDGVRARWSGMVTANHIWRLISLLREYLEKESALSWAAVSVWGFEDAPVSWKNNEHGWLCSGDNHYSLVLFRTGQFWHFSSMATHDTP